MKKFKSNLLLFVLVISGGLIFNNLFNYNAIICLGATITEQWEEEYSKLGQVMHKYALNTKFKELKGVMVVPNTREVIWLTEKCSFSATGMDDCDFYLQNIQTLMSIEENPICRRTGGLSFSLDPWDSTDIWGNSYRKVYYPEACSSILKTSIAGATMFDADWDLKQLVNNTLGIGSDIYEDFRSVDQLEDLNNYYYDPIFNQSSAGSSSSSTTSLTMTRMWMTVTNIEEAVTPDHSILYFGNVSLEVRAASIVRNISNPSGFSDSPYPPPLAYRRIVEYINLHMTDIMRRLKSFRQLAQLAVAQEAVKFIYNRQGKFPDGYLQALDYVVDMPQQVPAVVHAIEHSIYFEFVSQLLRSNHTTSSSSSMLEDDIPEILTTSNIKQITNNKQQSNSVQENGDFTTYEYTCNIINGSIAQIHSFVKLLQSQLLTFNCEQIADISTQDDPKMEDFTPPSDNNNEIFQERPSLGDPCLPGALAVWDEQDSSYFMIPSSYLFIPGTPRMYNITGDIVVVKWSCPWGHMESEEVQSEEEEEQREGMKPSTSPADSQDPSFSTFETNSAEEEVYGTQEGSSGRSQQGNSGYFTHLHTHYAYDPADRNTKHRQQHASSTRHLQLQYNLTLSEFISTESIDADTISLQNKIILLVMPRSWESLPPVCGLPQVLYELQTEWIFDANAGSNADSMRQESETIDLDRESKASEYTTHQHPSSRYVSSSIGLSKIDRNSQVGFIEDKGKVQPAGVILVHHTDFLSPVVEINSDYLEGSSLEVPLRMVSNNYGKELLAYIAKATSNSSSSSSSGSSNIHASMACGINRENEVKPEDVEDSDSAEDAVFSVDFGKSVYRTLDAVNIHSTTVGCQAEYIAIPLGYEVVPVYEDILTHVVGKYDWGTEMLILADGHAYATKLAAHTRPGKQLREIPLEWESQPDPSGSNRNGSELNHENSDDTSQYIVSIRPSVCASRILIRTKAVMVPYGGFFYHTLDLAEVSSTTAGCQQGPYELPSFVDVAPAISDVIHNIVAAHHWGTDVLVLQDRRGYFTAQAGGELPGKMCCERQELLFVADEFRNITSSNSMNSMEEEQSNNNNSSDASSWRDVVQMLSVLRCNARILVRQPIVTYVYNTTTAFSSQQFVDVKRSTQAVNLNITRISHGHTDQPPPHREYKGGKLLPGIVRNHLYSVSMQLKYSLFTHGGVDLMHIKVKPLQAGVPMEVLQQLQDRLKQYRDANRNPGEDGRWSTTEEVDEEEAYRIDPSTGRIHPEGAGQSPKNTHPTDSSTDQTAAPTISVKQAQPTEQYRESSRQQELYAASSTALDQEFTAEFQERRSSWGKRLGSALDHLDDHILGNTIGTGSSGSSRDFIYRPAVYVSAATPPVSSTASVGEVSASADLPAVSVSHTASTVEQSLYMHETAATVEEVFALLQEPVSRVKVARRRILGEGYSRAISALLIETATTNAVFLVQYNTDGIVSACQVQSIASSSVSSSSGATTGGSTATLHTTLCVAARSDTASTERDLVRWHAQAGEWRLQQRWTDVPSIGDSGSDSDSSISSTLSHKQPTATATLVLLINKMQNSADQRSSQYHIDTNNEHLCQEDGRRFLGLTVDIAQYLQI